MIQIHVKCGSMAKFWKKKTVVLDPLSIELDEFEVSYLFIKKSNDPKFKEILSTLEEMIPRENFVYHCENQEEKDLIQNFLNFD